MVRIDTDESVRKIRGWIFTEGLFLQTENFRKFKYNFQGWTMLFLNVVWIIMKDGI